MPLYFTREGLIILAKMGKPGVYFLVIPSEVKANRPIPKRRLQELHRQDQIGKAVWNEMQKYMKEEDEYMEETFRLMKAVLPKGFVAFHIGWMFFIGRTSL